MYSSSIIFVQKNSNLGKENETSEQLTLIIDDRNETIWKGRMKGKTRTKSKNNFCRLGKGLNVKESMYI